MTTKICPHCKGEIQRKKKYSNTQWKVLKHCSINCASLAREIKRRKARIAISPNPSPKYSKSQLTRSFLSGKPLT